MLEEDLESGRRSSECGQRGRDPSQCGDQHNTALPMLHVLGILIKPRHCARAHGPTQVTDQTFTKISDDPSHHLTTSPSQKRESFFPDGCRTQNVNRRPDATVGPSSGEVDVG